MIRPHARPSHSAIFATLRQKYGNVCDIMFPVERLHFELIRRHVSRTRPRDEIYLALGRLGSCRIAALIDELTGRIDKTTIYRTISLFISIGVVTRPSHGLIELAEPYRQHHHHIICPTCGKRTNFLDHALEKNLQRIISHRKLKLSGHHVELAAICGQCTVKRLPLHSIPLTTDIA